MAAKPGTTAVGAEPEELSRIYRALFQASHDVIVLQDEAHRIVDINPRAAELTGYTVPELLHMSASRELVVPAEVDRVTEILEEVRRGATREYDVRWRAKDGRIIEFDVISVPLYLSGRKSAWTFCSLRDVTGRKKVERELRENEKRLQQILATLPVGLSVTNIDGDIVMSNTAAKRLWGEIIVPGPERRARSKGYWHGTGRRIEASEWPSVRALRDGETILNQLIDVETFDGRRIIMQNSVAPIRSQDDRIVGCVIVNEDVTERVRAENGLRRAVEELEALSVKLVGVQETERHALARELHDRIGQNLTALGINLDIVKERVGKDAESASRLQDSRGLLKETFDAMIDLLSELRPPMLDDLGLVAALNWYARKFTARTGLQVCVAADGRALTLDAEVEIVLFRIAQEALNNVAKHARAHRVDVALKSSDGELVLSISDDGVGVDTEANGAPRAAGGFGMVTMRERARAIHGRLEVRRRPEGGTSVIVTVPAA